MRDHLRLGSTDAWNHIEVLQLVLADIVRKMPVERRINMALSSKVDVGLNKTVKTSSLLLKTTNVEF